MSIQDYVVWLAISLSPNRICLNINMSSTNFDFGAQSRSQRFGRIYTKGGRGGRRRFSNREFVHSSIRAVYICPPRIK